MSSELQLAALLCSRLCHDLIGPLSALNNGLEVLADEDDPEMREHAMSLLTMSGSQASAKLQFARLAFGSASGSPAQIDPEDARACIVGILEAPKFELTWSVPSRTLDKDIIKILMNSALLIKDAIPRGGRIDVRLEDGSGALAIEVAAHGEGARVAEAVHAALSGRMAIDTVEPRTVQPYFLGLLVRARNAKVTFDKRDATTAVLRISA